MFQTIPVPVKGDGLRATWGAAVANGVNALARMTAAGTLAREGIGCGAEPLPENRRNRIAADRHPWKVYALAQSEDVDHCFEIYIPDNSLTLGGIGLEIEGVSPVDGSDCRYTFDGEAEMCEGATVFVAVVRSEGEGDDTETSGVSADEDEDDGEGVAAKVIVSTAGSLPEPEDGETFVAVFPVASVSADDSGDYPVGRVSRQFAKSVVALAEPGHEPDGISTDLVTDEEAEDPNALQIKDFDNDESDSEQGLVQRIEVVKDGDGEDASYHLEAKDHKGDVFLLARVNGKIRYIPITGTVEEEEEEEEPEEEDPCKHPGSDDKTGGVSPDGENGGWGTIDESLSKDSSGHSTGGGVTGGGDQHEGNACNGPDCNS